MGQPKINDGALKTPSGATVVTPLSKQHWLTMRADNINSTEVSALFGVNPYMTEFELWHTKKSGEIVELEENDRMFIGSGLETAIANMAGKRLDKAVVPMKDYHFMPELRIGSSFDYQTVFGEILEIKNVDYLIYKSKWLEDGDDIEAPPHIELQLQTQLLVSGKARGYICALVGGNDLKIIPRDANLNVQAAIQAKVVKFWKSIYDNAPPKVNFETDSDYLISMMNFAEPGKMYEGDTEALAGLVAKYKEAGEKEKVAQSEKKQVKAEILTIIGDSEKVKASGFSISAGVRAPVLIEAHERAGFRDFRVFEKKNDK